MIEFDFHFIIHLKYDRKESEIFDVVLNFICNQSVLDIEEEEIVQHI